MDHGKFTLHRKRPESSEDKMVVSGTKEELLEQFENVPPSKRSEYSMMDGGMRFSHLEMENMLRQKKEPRES